MYIILGVVWDHLKTEYQPESFPFSLPLYVLAFAKILT